MTQRLWPEPLTDVVSISKGVRSSWEGVLDLSRGKHFMFTVSIRHSREDTQAQGHMVYHLEAVWPGVTSRVTGTQAF